MKIKRTTTTKRTVLTKTALKIMIVALMAMCILLQTELRKTQDELIFFQELSEQLDIELNGNGAYIELHENDTHIEDVEIIGEDI